VELIHPSLPLALYLDVIGGFGGSLAVTVIGGKPLIVFYLENSILGIGVEGLFTAVAFKYGTITYLAQNSIGR